MLTDLSGESLSTSELVGNRDMPLDGGFFILCQNRPYVLEILGGQVYCYFRLIELYIQGTGLVRLNLYHQSHLSTFQ